jgi:hypothetical protein
LLAGTSSYRSNDGFGVIKLWIDDGMQTIPIALPEPEVPDMPIVYRQIMPFGFTDDESLVVNGEFVADEGRLQFGNSWVYKDGNLRRVGLYDEAHRRANGSMKTEVTEILHGKFIIGHSDRYDQYSEQGLTMWVDDGSGAVPLELVTAEDDYNDLLFSTLAASNEKGQLAGGTIFRTESGTSVARPWFYDPVTGVIPIEVPDGMRITMKGLTETGWLYGSLAPVAGLPYGQGSAFLWSPSTGFVRLSAMLSNDFSIADFRPDEIVQGIGSSLFAGYGTNANGTFAFMAIAVPEPSGIMLLAIALTTLSRKRRLAA